MTSPDTPPSRCLSNKSAASLCSVRIVENAAERVTLSGNDAAHTVAIHPVIALLALDRPIMNREGDGIALPKGYYLGTALHAWSLFGQDKLASCEIGAYSRIATWIGNARSP